MDNPSNGDRPLVDGREVLPADYMRPIVWKEGDEASFQCLFARSLTEPAVARIYDWPPIADIRTEYRVGCAKCDVVAFHVDGSITVFELKRAGMKLRDYMTGVGQLINASVQFGVALSRSGRHEDVRLVLAVPTGVVPDVGFACLAAGIVYMPFGEISTHNINDQKAREG